MRAIDRDRLSSDAAGFKSVIGTREKEKRTRENDDDATVQSSESPEAQWEKRKTQKT